MPPKNETLFTNLSNVQFNGHRPAIPKVRIRVSKNLTVMTNQNPNLQNSRSKSPVAIREEVADTLAGCDKADTVFDTADAAWAVASNLNWDDVAGLPTDGVDCPTGVPKLKLCADDGMDARKLFCVANEAPDDWDPEAVDGRTDKLAGVGAGIALVVDVMREENDGWGGCFGGSAVESFCLDRLNAWPAPNTGWLDGCIDWPNAGRMVPVRGWKEKVDWGWNEMVDWGCGRVGCAAEPWLTGWGFAAATGCGRMDTFATVDESAWLLPVKFSVVVLTTTTPTTTTSTMHTTTATTSYCQQVQQLLLLSPLLLPLVLLHCSPSNYNTDNYNIHHYYYYYWCYIIVPATTTLTTTTTTATTITTTTTKYYILVPPIWQQIQHLVLLKLLYYYILVQASTKPITTFTTTTTTTTITVTLTTKTTTTADDFTNKIDDYDYNYHYCQY